MSHKVIAVTPAGRRAYLDLLKNYILKDSSIDEWHLWDNCRDPDDRAYLAELERDHAKIRIVRVPSADGTNRSVNRFYRFCDDENAFYIKMDDDLVLLPEGLGRRMYDVAITERGTHLWWSPVVVNNAICSWVLQHFGLFRFNIDLTAQASSFAAWRSPYFAAALHRAYLDAIEGDRNLFEARLADVPNLSVSLSRFSINCIGFFGSDVAALGPLFCPPDIDDEEWLSAVLPAKIGRPGRVIGGLAVAHFSFFTQEAELVRTDILERYYRIAQVEMRYRPQVKPARLMGVPRRLRLAWAHRYEPSSYEVSFDA